MMKSYSEIADQIGALRAVIKQEQDRLKQLEAILKDEGVITADGDLYRVAISYDVQRSTTNWKKIAERFNPSRQIISGNTTASFHDRVNVSALPKH
jgi:hypothetical protein